MIPQMSAMDRFKLGGGGEAFERGRMVGHANVSPVLLAMRDALDRYHSQMQASTAAQTQFNMQDTLNKNEQLYKQQAIQGGGGIRDFMSGAVAPEGYNVVPEYDVDSATRSVIKKPRFVKAQSGMDKITSQVAANMEKQRKEAEAAAASKTGTGVSAKPAGLNPFAQSRIAPKAIDPESLDILTKLNSAMDLYNQGE